MPTEEELLDLYNRARAARDTLRDVLVEMSRYFPQESRAFQEAINAAGASDRLEGSLHGMSLAVFQACLNGAWGRPRA